MRQTRVRTLASTVVQSAMAVLAVSVLLSVLLVAFGEARRPAATPTGKRVSGPGPAAAPAVTSVVPEDSPTPTDSPAPNGPGPTPTRTAEPTPSPSALPTTGLPGVEVVVLNASSRTGLAARTSSRLRADGWQVALVGNFIGDLPESTVYYPDGQQQGARRLAGALGIGRLHTSFGGVSATRLTAVLTPSFGAPS